MDWELVKRADAPGVTGRLPYDPVQYCILAGATAIAWAYTIELDLLIIYTFRRRSGVYFWSLLISSWGCSLHALAFILKFLVGASWLLYLPFVEIGQSYPVTYDDNSGRSDWHRLGLHGNGTSTRTVVSITSCGEHDFLDPISPSLHMLWLRHSYQYLSSLENSVTSLEAGRY